MLLSVIIKSRSGRTLTKGKSHDQSQYAILHSIITCPFSWMHVNKKKIAKTTLIFRIKEQCVSEYYNYRMIITFFTGNIVLSVLNLRKNKPFESCSVGMVIT